MATGRAARHRIYGEDQAIPGVVSREYAEFHEGPIPPPHQLAAYEGVEKGMANRIMTMAEKSLDAEIKSDLIPAKAEARALLIATASGSLLPWGILIAGLVLILTGNDGIGFVAVAVGLLAYAPQIIASTRRAFRRQPNAKELDQTTPPSEAQ